VQRQWCGHPQYPGGDDGDPHGIGYGGHQCKQPDCTTHRSGSLKSAAMPTRLSPLRDDGISARGLCARGFRYSRGSRKPFYPALAQGGRLRLGKQTHDRGNSGRTSFQHGSELRGKIRRRRVGGLRWHLWAKLPQETTQGGLGGRVPHRRRIGRP